MKAEIRTKPYLSSRTSWRFSLFLFSLFFFLAADLAPVPNRIPANQVLSQSGQIPFSARPSTKWTEVKRRRMIRVGDSKANQNKARLEANVFLVMVREDAINTKKI